MILEYHIKYESFQGVETIQCDGEFTLYQV